MIINTYSHYKQYNTKPLKTTFLLQSNFSFITSLYSKTLYIKTSVNCYNELDWII